MLAMLSGPLFFGCGEFVAVERKAIQSLRPADFATPSAERKGLKGAAEAARRKAVP